MTFGFPAFHKESIKVDGGKDIWRNCIISKVRNMNFENIQEGKYTVDFRHGSSFCWWKEIIHIEIHDDYVEFKSSCWFKWQCIDWGCNKRNVLMVIKRVISVCADGAK